MGKKIFNNLNLFTYNLFNYFYKRIIVKEKPEYISEWITNGYQKIQKVPNDYINNINENLKDQYNVIENNQKDINKNGYFWFEITDKIKDNILKIINEPLQPLLKNLKIYYNSDIILANINITRNYNIEKKTEKFSNFFHNDAYIFTLIKIFINLHDVDKKHGPLRFIKNKDSKSVIKKDFNNIKLNRLDHITQEDLVNHNIGLKGEVFICDTTKIIHSAGIPESNQFRDMLFLEFCAYPKKKDIASIDKNIIKQQNFPNSIISKSISKPVGFRKLINCFFSYF